jgi:RHS repeat-associated protein
VVINSSGTTVEKSHYYPFGMRFFPESTSNSAAIGFRYNGKEFETMNGLNRYDYGKRMYDPALGRWHVADSRAEKYFSYSPYNYCANNPLNFIDPQGDTIKYAGATEEAAYNDYKNTVKSRVQAYDKRTQTLRDKGKTERADKRDANRSDNAYVQIQGELGAAESDENIFMIRMGGNISNKAGDGNISYNSSTQEIDVNISLGGGWTTMQKVAHEFKHVDQFINFMLDLNPNGGGGLLYDKTDEVAAFERQNLFGTRVDAKTFVNENYSDRREGPKSFHLLTPIEQTQYKSTKYIYHGKK